MKFSFEMSRGSNRPGSLPRAAMGPGEGRVMGSALRPPMPPASPHQAAFIRQVMAINETTARAYDAAVTTQYNMDFRSTYGSANAEFLSSNYTAFARSRNLVANTPHGKNAVRIFQDNVIGPKGFRLDMRYGKMVGKKFIPDTKVNRMIEEEYEIAGRPENFSVRQDISRAAAWRQMEAGAITVGSTLCRLHSGYPHNPYRFAVDILETDRLDKSYMGDRGKKEKIRFSVQYDEWNRPEVYWLLTRHPGEPFGMNTIGNPNVFREPVPAAEMIVYNNLRDRPESDLGFTELDSVTQSMHQDRQFSFAMMMAAISSCCKPFWIKKTLPTGMVTSADEYGDFLSRLATSGIGGPQVAADGQTGGETDPVARQQGTAQKVNLEKPGQTLDMNYGEELQQVDPRYPFEAVDSFKKTNWLATAVGIGISYPSLTGDFQNLGFSATRAMTGPERQNYKKRQVNFIDSVERPYFRQWLKHAILSGRLDLDILKIEDYVNAANWLGVRWEFPNPLQDVQALVLKLQNKLITPQQAQDQLPDGISFEDLMEAWAEAEEIAEANGIELNPDAVTAPPIDGEADPNGVEIPDGAQPPKKKKTANPVRGRNGHVALRP